MELLRQLFDSVLPNLVFTFLTSLIITLVTIPVVINVARLKHLIDEPNDRSSHRYRTPTLGGVAIFIAVSLSFLVWVIRDDIRNLHVVIASLIILFFIGIKDDILVISPVKKLIAQIVATLIVIIGADIRISSFFGIMGIYELPYIMSVLLTVFVFIVLINSFNLIDGIDGLAGGIGIIVSSVFGIWFFAVREYSYAILTVSLIASLIGFLNYNFSLRHKIFMGDTGSLIVGFLLAVFMIKFIAMNEQSIATNYYIKNAPAVAIAVYIIPLFDTLRVFILRILRGKSPFHADKNHIHHILIANKMTHFQASTILYCINIAFIVILYFTLRSTSISISFLILLALFVIYYFSLKSRSR